MRIIGRRAKRAIFTVLLSKLLAYGAIQLELPLVVLVIIVIAKARIDRKYVSKPRLSKTAKIRLVEPFLAVPLRPWIRHPEWLQKHPLAVKIRRSFFRTCWNQHIRIPRVMC
jgi:hypothetical protein